MSEQQATLATSGAGWAGENGVRITKDESSGVLKIAGTLSIPAAEDVRKALSDAFNGNSGPVLDLSGIEDCDTAGLQLLWSAINTAQRLNKRLRLLEIPSAVAEIAAVLGLPLQQLTACQEGAAGAI